MKRVSVCVFIMVSLIIASSAWAYTPNRLSKEAYDKGFHAAMHNNYPEADKQLKRAVELDPKNLDALNVWGVTLSKLGRNKEAFQKFDTATKIDPKFAKAWFNWGVTLAESGDKKNAAVKFQRTVALRPDFSLAYENWGLTLISLGEKQKGIEKLRLAAKYDPQKAPQINQVIKGLEKKEQPAKPGRR